MASIDEDLKKYSVAIALNWKIESNKLLYRYKESEQDFEKVLRDVVGKGGGGVLRGIKKECFSSFSKYVLENFEVIKKGKFDIFEVKSFPDKQPISFISKICHIINPKAYPLIFDRNVKKKLRISDSGKINEKWNQEIDKRKNILTNDEEIYKYDSELWYEGSILINKKEGEK